MGSFRDGNGSKNHTWAFRNLLYNRQFNRHDCPPPREAWDGVLGCAPFGRCYLKCGSQWNCLIGGSCISVPPFEDKACMYWLH
ncbi:hypothetical protein FOZ63_019717 [Perkinsus olseni]|uniref:Uncharacterized protein n=1 Tax=Perkinsus olseni TaxID=32597 RepID=A0A7J6SE00_PEROL|nr:hypothetical protein FOZ63_019717 [Perkinsus olseni]